MSIQSENYTKKLEPLLRHTVASKLRIPKMYASSIANVRAAKGNRNIIDRIDTIVQINTVKSPAATCHINEVVSEKNSGDRSVRNFRDTSRD